ncbi:hypothetical protein [uncultured Winogradskyella sp.]|uniref:hypothetical protein n=1 Tax=uncultured Winogradskyella sp. TaxID=395353 RepID=UPI0030D99E7A|tara:strand:+ start:12584 stop:12811 length:228 start_codon:yes stop_codon:yes gene_type:complete
MDILAQVNEIDVEAPGELQEGFLVASIKNVGTEKATVNGVTLDPGEAKGYPFVGKGYKKITYDTSGTTLRIMQIL